MEEHGNFPESYSKKVHNNVPSASTFGSASAQAAALYYTTNHGSINGVLRGSVPDFLAHKDVVVHATKELDKMFSVAKTKEPIVVYRGLNDIDEKSFFNEFSPGKEHQEKGYMSTTVQPSAAAYYSENTYGMVKILVPKGASALSLRYKKNGSAFSAMPHEEEILLPRNTKYRVIGYEKGNGEYKNFKKIPIVEIIE
jgi:hypothetical protein